MEAESSNIRQHINGIRCVTCLHPDVSGLRFGTQACIVLSLMVGTYIPLHAQQSFGTLEGVVFDKATRQPLPSANVMLVRKAADSTRRDPFGEGTLGTTTDANGHFQIFNIPERSYTVKFSLIGYKEKLVRDVQVNAGGNPSLREKNVLNVTLEETSIQGEEVVVTPKLERYDATGISARLGKEMITGTPGSAQDIFWVIQTLPGIASDGDNSKLYVRGGSPDENLILYDGTPIRNPFHFDMMGGGFWSIFNSRLTEKVEFYASGFPARYGDRLSSVLRIDNRSADYDDVKGEASLSMSDVSGLIEVPLKFADGGAIIAVRRSYFDLALKTSKLAADYNVLPYFFDVNSKMDFILSSTQKLTLSGLYSKERIYGYFSANPHYTGDFAWESKNGIAGARLRSVLSESVISDLILSFASTDRLATHPNQGIESINEKAISLNTDISFMLPSNELHVGGWLVSEKEDVLINLPKEIAPNFEEVRLRGYSASLKPSLYVDSKWNINSDLSTSVGVRYDYFARSNASTLSPRIQLAYAWNDHMSVSADYGWYYQSPKAFELGMNDQLKSRKSESFGIGMKHQVGDEIVVSIEMYNKNLTQLITIDSLWNLKSDGYGYARGAEFFVQVKSPYGFLGWLSYTYSVSKRKDGAAPDLHYVEFDRPHLVSLVANYSFAEHWQIGARFRFGSGRPYTSVASAVFDPTANHWLPIPAEHNGERFPSYSRLDVRVTRQFVFETFKLNAYIELLNLYNKENVIHYMWNERYTGKEAFTIFPFLPVLGVSAQFN